MTHQTIKIGPCTVLHGNCLQALEDLPANFDALITDPPYSSGGMVRGDRNRATSEKYQHGDTDKLMPEFGGDSRDQRGKH